MNQTGNRQLAQRQQKMIQTVMLQGQRKRRRRDSKKEAEAWRGGMRAFENEKRLDARVLESVLWDRLRNREKPRKLKLSLVMQPC